MTSRLQLAFAANRRYRPYLCTALASVRHGLRQPVALSVTILSSDLEVGDIRWPNRGPDDHVRCVAPEIPPSTPLPIRPGDHLTVETYYRLFIEYAFTREVDRVIYLDADLVVLEDLFDLFSVDLAGHTVGAVQDLFVGDWSRASPPLPSSGARECRPYFNAGVLVIDLNAWRERQVARRALEFIAANISAMRYWDQDALNFALDGDWCELDPRWNRISHFWQGRSAGSLPIDREQVLTLSDPFVVHFASDKKPWEVMGHPDRRHFNRFASLAGFGDCRMTAAKAAMGYVRRKFKRFAGRWRRDP